MIQYFKDIHCGETCIVIGNGPSLNLVPRDFLLKYKSFGQNKIYLMRDFVPTYYVATDPSNLEKEEIDNLPCTKFIRAGFGFRRCHEFKLTRDHVFSLYPDLYVYEGYSVTFVSLQLAYYMGFSTVLLVGVDHRYTPYDAVKETDPNHFTPDYGGVTDWSPRSLEKGEREIPASMQLARDAYERAGRRVINLTPGSRLETFEFGKLEDW